MFYRFFNVVDLQSRQYPFDITNGVKIKTTTEEFEITLENYNEQKMFDLVNSKTNFTVFSSKSCLIVNTNQIVGILYTEN